MLTPKETLQIDATLLAGLLILMTIISFDDTEKTNDNLYLEPRSQLFFMGMGFGISSIFALFASIVDKDYKITVGRGKNEKEKIVKSQTYHIFSMLSFAAMLTGFIFLVWIFFVIGEFESLTNTGLLGGNEEVMIDSEKDFLPDIGNNEEIEKPNISAEENSNPDTTIINETDKIKIDNPNSNSQINP